MPDHQNGNRRKDFRVDDMLPMKDTLLNKEAFKYERTHIGIRSRQSSMLRNMVGNDIFSTVTPEIDSDLCNALGALDAKLNYLIGVNMLNDANRCNLDERLVNLSVTGMSFVTSCSYKVRDAMKIILMLPALPPMVIEVLALVQRVKPAVKGRAHVGVSFVYRCGEEEDQISRYIFKRHREMIRIEAHQQIARPLQ